MTALHQARVCSHARHAVGPLRLTHPTGDYKM